MPLLRHITYYELLFSITYLNLVTLLDFSMFSFFLGVDKLINDNNDKYNNNRHISIEIINFENTETT